MVKPIILIILVVALLVAVFYFFIPIKNSPLSGGPVDANHPPRALKKVSMYEYTRLEKALVNRSIVE
jgi:flagellar basal body-associated protein FliL